MTRRRIGLGLILFLLATTAAAPVAFWVGNFSAVSQLDEDYEASRRPGEFVDITDAVWHCDQFGDFEGLRTYDRLRECGPGFAVPTQTIDAYYGPAGQRRRGPLQLATARSIANDAFGPTETQGTPSAAGFGLGSDPISAALDPTGSAPPAMNGGAGIPPTLLLADAGPDLPPVPVPGALPLLLTGLLGLGGLRKTRSARR